MVISIVIKDILAHVHLQEQQRTLNGRQIIFFMVVLLNDCDEWKARRRSASKKKAEEVEQTRKELSVEHQQEINTHGAANKKPRL